MKLRASTKLAIGFVAVCGGVFFGYKFITDRMILGEKFPEIKPGNATLLGIDSGSGYHIVVANDVAALVEGAAKLETGEMSATASDTDTRKKIAIKDMMRILQGEEEPLGRFIMAMNDIKEGNADWPTQPAVWNAEDVEKALKGDAKLRTKLESDLNVKLDGTPLDVVSVNALQNGILIMLPVPIPVMIGGKDVTLIGRVKDPFRPRFCQSLENLEVLKQKYYTVEMLRGVYREEAAKVKSGLGTREDIAKILGDRLSQERIARLAEGPTNVLSKARIILNENFIESARLETAQGTSGKTVYGLVLNLNDEGRRRLWQYSKLHLGTQLLFVVNGMAIAAPVVGAEIPQAQVTITNLTDGDLAKDAVDTLNRHQPLKGRNP